MSLAVAVAAAAGSALYLPLLSGLVREWVTDPTVAHGAFVVLAAIVLVFRRWAAARSIPAAPAATGYLVLAGAMVVYLVGMLTGDLFVQRASLPLTLGGVIVAALGWNHARMFVGPLFLLALAIPLPAVLITWFTLPLQLLASRIAAGTLDVLQVDVVRQGNLLALKNVTLEVANVCSGLRSIIALFSLAAVTVTFFSFTLPRRVILLVAVVPVAVVGNGLRIAATGLLATQIGAAAVRGRVHECTGFAGFLVMCAVMFTLVRFTWRLDVVVSRPVAEMR